MCLAIPARIAEVRDEAATVEFGGLRRDISLMLLPEAQAGDYVLVHAGYAIQRLDEVEAEETLRLLREMLVE